MNILITGGLGFVGGRLVKKLSADSPVIVSSRRKASDDELQQYAATKCVLHSDLLNKGSFPSDVHTVVHLAALNEWDCVQFPSEAIRVNIDETRIILENAISCGVKKFIYLSTAHVYGSLTGHITEYTLPLPLHPYAITHKAAEDFILAATMKGRIKGIILRLSNSFGSPVVPTVNRWTLVANNLARQAIETGSLLLESSGLQYRDFVCLTDVENTVRILAKQTALCTHAVYNLGSGKSMRVLDIAERIQQVYKSIYNKQIEIKLKAAYTDKPEDHPALEFSIKRLNAEGILMSNNFNEELVHLILFCSQHFKQKR